MQGYVGCQIPAAYCQSLRHACDTGDRDGTSGVMDFRGLNRQVVISAAGLARCGRFPG